VDCLHVVHIVVKGCFVNAFLCIFCNHY